MALTIPVIEPDDVEIVGRPDPRACTRCKLTIEQGTRVVITTLTPNTWTELLCDDCSEALLAWLDNGEGSARWQGPQ